MTRRRVSCTSKQALLDDARERARRLIEESRAQRQRDIEGWTSVGELADRITAAVDEARRGPAMSVEEALAMIDGFGETRH